MRVVSPCDASFAACYAHMFTCLSATFDINKCYCRLALALHSSHVEALLALGGVMSGRAILEALDPEGAHHWEVIQGMCTLTRLNPVTRARATLGSQLAASAAKWVVQQAVAAGNDQASTIVARPCVGLEWHCLAMGVGS